MAREYTRNQRLGTQVMRTLSELIRRESKDPRLDGVALTAVDVSRDLGVAEVYYSLLVPDQDPAEAQAGLESAAGFLRSKLGQAIKIRRSPELRFIHDESSAESARINALLAGSGQDSGQD
ncbi:MAG: 30S ribosome-binding factor RbfA [Woeseiaceae bacterium]|nr:30S ribosome-binding factor RbfA [Woeseiaceae bacterium]